MCRRSGGQGVRLPASPLPCLSSVPPPVVGISCRTMRMGTLLQGRRLHRAVAFPLSSATAVAVWGPSALPVLGQACGRCAASSHTCTHSRAQHRCWLPAPAPSHPPPPHHEPILRPAVMPGAGRTQREVSAARSRTGDGVFLVGPPMQFGGVGGVEMGSVPPACRAGYQESPWCFLSG